MIGALFLILAASAAPVQPAESAPAIIVTGRGLDPFRGDALFDVSTIERDALARSSSNRLEDVLRVVPGFQQFRRSDSRSANPTSQGATLRALGGNASSRALLVLDGVPQSDPFGGWISWPAYDPRQLGRIRVIRGGGGGADGPGALAGTIEMESAAPDEARGLTAGLSLGSRDGIDAHAGLGLDLGRGFVALSGAYACGDGFIPVVAGQRGAADIPAPYRQWRAGLRAVTPLGGEAELQANASAFSDHRARGTAFSAIATTGADASLRLVARGRLPFSLLAYVQLRDFSNRFASIGDGRDSVAPALDQYSVPATGLGARAQLRPLSGPLDLRLGVDWRETVGRTQELYAFQAGAPTRGRVAGGRTRTIGAYAELAWTGGPVTLTGAGRIDRWWILDGRLHERMLADGAVLTDTSFPDRGGWAPTGRAGLAWRVAPPLTLRAAAYRGWRLPTLNELYRPFRVGADATAANAALAPERLDGIEAGLDLRPTAAARIGLTLFDNRLSHAIGNVTLGQGPGTFPGVGFVSAAGSYSQRRNLDAIASRGVEIDASLTLGAWRLAAGYSHARARVRAGGAAAALDGLRPAQAPRDSASATIAWRSPRGAEARLRAIYAGARYEDDLNTQRIPDALTFDALGVVPIGRTLAIEVRAENLTNARVVAGISGAGVIERASPRTLWIGLSWRS